MNRNGNATRITVLRLSVDGCWSVFAFLMSLAGMCFHVSQSQLLAQPAEGEPSKQFSLEDIEFFEKQIRPILIDRCYECHAGVERAGGLSLESREQIFQGGDSGPALQDDPSNDSLLLRAVSYQNADLQMPPNGKLSDSEIAALHRWVSRGAPDTRRSAVVENSPAPLQGMSLEDGRQFWAFRPVTDPPIPDVRQWQWVQSPIDAFVLKRLEQAGVDPAPAADRRTLIRRLSLNLTGLPPTVAEVDAFVNDQSVAATEKLIDRLIASPHYGVRWGRHWLDVARYADSNGLDENLAFGNAWRYRDYVVNAFNHDKAYNRFVQEQIAGDLMPGANQETCTATGFLSLGAKVLAEPDVEKLVMDTIDEQIDTLGKAFMGLSLGCARCHDHKFDPLTQRDYYALAAIFKGTRTFSKEKFGAIKYWFEHSFTQPEDLAAIQQVETEIAAAKNAASQFKSKTMSDIRQLAQRDAAKYLSAAASLQPGMTLGQVAAVAEPMGLHPRILYHCRSHLEIHKQSEFFLAWHQMSSQPEEILQHYESLFQVLEGALRDARQTDPAINTLSDPRLEQARRELQDPSGFLVVPPQAEYAMDAQQLREYHHLMNIARLIESQAMDYPQAMGVSDQAVVQKLAIHIRGSHLNLGESVARDFPAVLRTSVVSPIFPEGQSGRAELADWLASSTHPLTARVIVNRVWGWHFGRPLVTTTENFGVQGAPVSHPELLDWLARRFMASGWSIKWLNRMILKSSTYQMACENPNFENAQQLDPDNEWLWRFRRNRLDAEQLRDSVLVVCGNIDNSLGGKTVPLRNRQFVFDHTSIDHTKYDSHRRSLYLPIIRNNLYTLLEQFDFPDPTMPTGWRHSTTVAPQSLLLLNSDLLVESAERLASDLVSAHSDDEMRLSDLFQRLFARPPTQWESQHCHQFLSQFDQRSSELSAPVEIKLASSNWQPQNENAAQSVERAWALLIQSLMATNDFLYVN